MKVWSPWLKSPEQRGALYIALLEHVTSGKYQVAVSRGGSHAFKWMVEADQRALINDLSIMTRTDILSSLWTSSIPYFKKNEATKGKMGILKMDIPTGPPPPPPPEEGLHT